MHRLKKAEKIKDMYKSMEYTIPSLAQKLNLTEDNINHILDSYNIHNRMQLTEENVEEKTGEPLNALIYDDSLEFLDSVSSNILE